VLERNAVEYRPPEERAEQNDRAEIAVGDLGSIILFGSVLAWAVYDRISLKRRSDPGGPPIPYGGLSNDIIAVVVGTIIYLAFGLVLHPLWIGVPVFGSAEVVT